MILRLTLVLILLWVFYQDYKDRLVYSFLFPIIAGIFVILFYINNYVGVLYMIYSIGFNLLCVGLIITILYLYSNLKLRKKFINHTFGLGDIFILIVITFGFPTYTFLLLYGLSMLFAVCSHVCLKQFYKHKTVPLAGYIALFYAIVIFFSNFEFFPSIYIL